MSRPEPIVSPRQCIVPPFIFEAVERNGTVPERALARQALAADQAIRAAARPVPVSGQCPPAAGAGPATPRLHRIVYDARHTTRVTGPPVRSEGADPVADADANRVYDAIGAVWELYRSEFGRHSLDNRGGPLTATVHFDTLYNNAFWDGSQMALGDGDGVLFTGFTATVDVLGHELTHAVTAQESNLAYHGQSGALNESLSDVFGAMVKQRAATPPQTADQADWLIGAGLFGPAVNGVALRSMAAPGTAYDDPKLGRDPQAAHMADFVHTTSDNGGVHSNSGIPNKAFQRFAVALGGHSWDRAGQVWYATATDRTLGSGATFQHFVDLTAAHAEALFGRSVADACGDAWAAVGLTVSRR